MSLRTLDVVELPDGRLATILEISEDRKSALVELADENGKTLDTTFAQMDELVLYAKAPF
jgi:hypothetical protein